MFRVLLILLALGCGHKPPVNRFIIAIFLCVACGKPVKPFGPVDQPPQDVVARFEDASLRLESMAEGGFVVSRWKASGEPEHRGDSLIWSGIYLGAASCEHAEATDSALQHMVAEEGGGLYRHPAIKTQASLDGALGYYWGVARRTRCPGKKELWEPLIAQHEAFSEPTGRLNPDSLGHILPEFTYVRDLLAWNVGARAKPHADRLRALEAEVTAWAEAVKLDHAACFRIHLGLLALQTVEALGEAISEGGKNGFCIATEGLDLPTVDHWCKRGDLDGWQRSFTANAWEFRHQRCGKWESPDGKDGLETPGLDLIVALAALYEFRNGRE